MSCYVPMYVADIFRAKMLVHDDAVNSFSLFLEQIIELYYSLLLFLGFHEGYLSICETVVLIKY